MTSFNSKLIFIATLLAFLNACVSSSPSCAPVSTNYSDDAKDETKYYRVKKDDTLYAISLLFNLDYRQLAQWNRIAPPSYTIEIGQRIRLFDPVWGSKLMPDDMDAEARATHGAVADDSRDGGGRATHGAVAETKQEIVAATKIISPQKKAVILNNKPNLAYKPPYKTQALKNHAEKNGGKP
jgi:lipoprotein NlpD